jgi:hypothetical protein
VRPPPKKELVKHERSAGPFVGLVVSYISAERRVPPDHPPQSIRVMVDVTCPAKAYQVEVEDSACVVGLWPEIPAVFALHRLK